MHCSWRPHLLHPSQALLKRAVAPYQTLVRNNFSSASSSIRCSAAPELTESESSEPDIDTLVELGVFGAVHGTGGELKLQAETDAVEERLSVPGRRCVTFSGFTCRIARRQAMYLHQCMAPLRVRCRLAGGRQSSTSVGDSRYGNLKSKVCGARCRRQA